MKKDIECEIQNKKIKAKNERYRNIKTKTQKEKKSSFPKEQLENVDLYKLVLKKNNERMQIMHKK